MSQGVGAVTTEGISILINESGGAGKVFQY